MSSRSKCLMKGGKPRPRGPSGVIVPRVAERFSDQRRVCSFILDNPGCSVRDVANACFDGSVVLAVHFINKLGSKGILKRRKGSDDAGTIDR